MRTGEIVDLSSERRLSAVLEFGEHGAELLVLNGGSRAEEVTIEAVVDKPHLRARRAAYCVDAGTSMQLIFPLLEGEMPDHLTVHLIAGSREIALAPPVRRTVAQLPVFRGSLALAAAAALFIVGGGRLDTARLPSGADLAAATIEATAGASPLTIAWQPLPHVIATAQAGHIRSLPHLRIARIAHVRLAHQAIVVARAVVAATPRARRAALVATRAPKITDLRVPMSATSGDTVPVAFHTDAKRVRIVASIGPTVVSRTTVASRSGVVDIKSPKSDRDGRIMMVRAYAESGSRMSSQEAMVVLVRP